MPTIDCHYFRVCTGGARRQGHDANPMLMAAGVDPHLIGRPGARGSTRAMARLVRAIVDLLDDENMGFCEQPMPRGSFAFAASLAIEGSSVLDGLMRAARFYDLANRDITTQVTESDGNLCFTYRNRTPALDPDRYFGEFWLIGWHRLACWLAAETVPLASAEFDYMPGADYLHEFRRLFPCPHRYDSTGRAIRMETRALMVPIKRTAADLRVMIARAPLDIMTIPAGDRDMTRRARQVLAKDPGLPAKGVAAALEVSSETLRRQLKREGLTLSAIRESWRRDAAIRALLRADRSIEMIAEDLGYAEARSFTRAFCDWTGHSPTNYRKIRLLRNL